MSTVTVVVPTFRRARLLSGALASLAAQTHDDVEVLVCDNDDSDEVAAVVEQAGARSGARGVRFTHVRRPRNLGMLRNAVEGFRAASGRYVTKLDDDDRLHPQALARFHDALEADPRATVAFGRVRFVDADDTPLPDRTARHEAFVGRDRLRPGPHAPFTPLVLAGTITLASALVRKDTVDWDRVPDAVATAYDRHVLLQAARDGAAARFVDETCVDYRLHDLSDTNTATARQRLGALAATELALTGGRNDGTDELRRACADLAVESGRLLLREGRAGEARPLLWRAAVRRPRADLARLALLSLLPADTAKAAALERAAAFERRVGAADQRGREL